MTAGVWWGESREVAKARGASTPVFLGGYRFLLAFFVFCAHSAWPLAQTVTRSEIGAVGVLNFFIVSGFLITLTIEVHYTRSVRRFLINRFLRIYPTLWVSTIIAVLAILLMGTTYVTANFYIRGWTWANILRCILIVPATGQNETWGPIPVGWTLQVEVSFYLVMAALFLLIGRLSQNKRHVAIICFCSASLLGYFVLMATTILAPSNGCRFVPFFVTGVITAIISRLETAQYAMRLFAGIVLTVALALCIKAVFFMGGLTPGYVIGTAVTFPFVCGLFFFLLWPPIAARLVRFKRIDTLLGDLTYPVYTLHFALNQVTAFWLISYLGPSTVFVQLAVTVAASYLLVRFVDRPISKVRSRVREASIATVSKGRAVRLAAVLARRHAAGSYSQKNGVTPPATA